MTVRVRFAPSPTGLLHVGNARIALVNWLYARRHGGRFMLRLDDTDRERSKPEFAVAIAEDLDWLGLERDETAAQSDRFDRYEIALRRLQEAGRAYPCYETPEELTLKRKRLAASGKPPVYDRAALDLSDADRAALEASGRRPHWRFRLEHGEIVWEDLVRGPVRFHGADLSDPVIVREDGLPLYTLSSCVDDVELAVSHVIRGEDHVANTAVQVQIVEALGGDPAGMAFAHLPLLVDAEGRGLSKRLGSLSLRALREQGIEPMAINSLLAFLGTSDSIEAAANLPELMSRFDLARVSRTPPRFDPAELERMNGRTLHVMLWEDVRPRLAHMGLAEAGEAFWQAVRGNLGRFAEVRHWYAVCYGSIEPVTEDPELLVTAADLLPDAPWDGGTWKAWTTAVGAATGRKGRALYRPLRRALTGTDRGPELGDLLPLIGPARARARLSGKAA